MGLHGLLVDAHPRAVVSAAAEKWHFVPQYGLVRAARSKWRISAARIKGTPGPVRTFVHPAANGGSEPILLKN